MHSINLFVDVSIYLLRAEVNSHNNSIKSRRVSEGKYILRTGLKHCHGLMHWQMQTYYSFRLRLTFNQSVKCTPLCAATKVTAQLMLTHLVLCFNIAHHYSECCYTTVVTVFSLLETLQVTLRNSNI